MKCPYCGSECEEGIVESKHTSFGQSWLVNTFWYPKEEEGKLFKNHIKSIPRKTRGYVCRNCRKVFAEYDYYSKEKDLN